jgi:hypothetical protein
MSSDDRNSDLITRLLGPEGPKSRASNASSLLDRYVDLEVAGEDPDAQLPGMRAHLDGCPACREDHESLRDFVTGGKTPAPGGANPPRRRPLHLRGGMTMSTVAAALRPVPMPQAEVLRRDPAAQAYMLLRIAFTVAPILFGLDKFAGC